MWLLSRTILAWIALGAGFVSAAGFVAFVSLIGIVPRLAAITKTAARIPLYENALALGFIFFNIISFYPIGFPAIPDQLGAAALCAAFLFSGVFVGCLAGAIAETLGTIPILARRLHLRQGLSWYVAALALGKMLGSLLQLYTFSRG